MPLGRSRLVNGTGSRVGGLSAHPGWLGIGKVGDELLFLSL